MQEKTKLEILNVFGYTPEDLNCANADTAFGEIFESDAFTRPTDIIGQFISNCSTEMFEHLKTAIIAEEE